MLAPQPQPAPDILDTALAAALVLAVRTHRRNHPMRRQSVPNDTPHRVDVIIGLRDGIWDVAVYVVVDGHQQTALFSAMGERTADGERILRAQGIVPYEPWRTVVLQALRSVADGQGVPVGPPVAQMPPLTGDKESEEP